MNRWILMVPISFGFAWMLLMGAFAYTDEMRPQGHDFGFIIFAIAGLAFLELARENGAREIASFQ